VTWPGCRVRPARSTRALARAIHGAHRDDWTFGDAVGFADTLIKDRHLEVKTVGIELLARYRRESAAGRAIGTCGYAAPRP
jgi:hypothetical protein